MKKAYFYQLSKNEFNQHFFIAKNGSYRSESFENRLSGLGLLIELLDSGMISPENGIFLIDELLYSSLPNLPKIFKSENDRIIDEICLLEKLEYHKASLKEDILIDKLPYLPYFLMCNICEKHGNIWFLDVDEDVAFSYDLYSKDEVFQWINKYAKNYSIDIIEIEKLRKQVEGIDSSRFPKHSKSFIIKDLSVLVDKDYLPTN